MGKFNSKWIICNLDSDSHKYICNAIHKNEQDHNIVNTYRFNRGVPYLVKNVEDYEEMIALPQFDDYMTTEVPELPDKSETTKEKKLKEESEAEANKKAVEESTNQLDEKKKKSKKKSKGGKNGRNRKN